MEGTEHEIKCSNTNLFAQKCVNSLILYTIYMI